MNDELAYDEIIEVIAVFRPGRTMCEPIRFRRKNGQVIEISEIGLRHPKPRGVRMIHVFDVTDGGADYRIEFDAEQLVWRLTREADRW